MSLSRARLLVFVASILGAGFVVGLVVSGRLELTTPSVAAVEEQTTVTPASPAAAVVTAGGTLPDLSTIAERALEVSVNISSTNLVQVPVDPFFGAFFGNRVQRSQSLGSGVIVSADGYILTNTHVIGNQSQSIRVTTSDGQERPARLIGIDEVSDLAVVKIDDTALPTLPWGDSGRLRVAEWVLAVGNPYQLSGTVTLGIVSTVSRSAEQVGSYQDFIQTDAAINPGNSGGALINARGELVGINTMIYSQTGGYQGIGFAIPSNQAREIMNELIQNGVVSWGSIGGIGLVTVDERAARRNDLPSTGAYVQNIYRNASAFRAGLEPGDLVVAINGQPVTSAEQIDRAVIRMKVGSTVTLRVIKGETGRTVDLRVPVVARTQR
jgi:S1-C subfamily serine protease